MSRTSNSLILNCQLLLFQDYRMKDLENNSDMTAQIFNERRAQRDADRDREEEERESELEQLQQQQQKQQQTQKRKIVPVPSTSSGYMTVG